jgi:uncharacterized protein
MPLERTPQPETAESSSLAKLLQAITWLTVRFPKVTIALAMAVTVAVLAVAVPRMTFRNSRADLLNPRSAYHQRWLAYTKEFGDKEDVVVVVESDKPDQVLTTMKDVADCVQLQPELFRAVMRDYDLARLRGKALHYLTPEELAGIRGFMDRASPVLQGDWNSLSVGRMTMAMATGIAPPGSAPPGSAPPAGPAEMLTQLEVTVKTLSAALESPDAYQSPWGSPLGATGRLNMLGSHPLVSDDGKLGFVMLKLATADKESFDPHTKGLNGLRQIVAQVNSRHPDVHMGLTGLPVVENDEMRASQDSMTRSSVVSFAGVALVFLAGFGGWRHPLIGNVALMAGMAWAFGFAALTIGHLNILSSAFGAILIGQGIDFGVYYLAGYIQQRPHARTSGEALVATAGCVGPSIATGAVSTAIAFFAAGFTEFTGVAELGMIAGGGILLCFIAAIVLLPAMIQFFDARRPVAAMPVQLELGRFLNRLHAHPLTTLTVLAVVTAVAAVGLRQLRYDQNLTNLQPAGLESVRLAETMMARLGQNAYYALSMAGSREEALARREALLRQPSVAKVEEIASVLPGDDPRRQPLIEQIHARLAGLPRVTPSIAVASALEIEGALGNLQMLLPDRPETQAVRGRIEAAREAIRKLDPAETQRRLGQYQQRLAADMLGQLTLLRDISDPQPPRWSDLPEALTTRFIGGSGKHLLKIYNRADIWDMPATERFIQEVRDVDPDATGNPMQIYEASRQMKRSYEMAAIYAMIIVCMVVFLDFGSPRYTLLALLPLGLGMLQLFGLMGLVNLPLNSANMIVLPLILGIGVDNGVHIVHDFRRQPRGSYHISNSTANAVVINSLGNMMGFGSLMIASHRGLQSLGRVLTLGMACCLISALAMPSLLMLLTRRREESSISDEDTPIARHPSPGPHRHEPSGYRIPRPRESMERTGDRLA